jgi:flagellar biogenesis protein FliO
MNGPWRETVLGIATRLRALPSWVWGVVALVGLGALAFLWDTGSPASVADPFAPPDWTMFLNVFLKLGVVLALIFIGFYFLKKWRVDGIGEDRRRLALIETLRFSPKQAVHLVRAEGRLLVIGATDQSLSRLAEWPETLNDEVTGIGESFADLTARS